MKKLSTLIMAGSLAALAACGGGADVAGNEGNAINATEENAAEPAKPAENGAAPANTVAAAGDDSLRSFLIGKWSETGDCADATEFRADGTFVFPWGDTGTWQLDGDQLTLSSNNTGPLRLARVDENKVDVTHPGGSVHHNTRC